MKALDDNWIRKGKTLVERSRELDKERGEKKEPVITPPQSLIDIGCYWKLTNVSYRGKTVDVNITKKYLDFNRQHEYNEWLEVLEDKDGWDLPDTEIYHASLDALARVDETKGRRELLSLLLSKDLKATSTLCNIDPAMINVSHWMPDNNSGTTLPVWSKFGKWDQMDDQIRQAFFGDATNYYEEKLGRDCWLFAPAPGSNTNVQIRTDLQYIHYENMQISAARAVGFKIQK